MTKKSKCCNAEILTDAEDTSGNCLDVCSECRHECDVTDEGKDHISQETKLVTPPESWGGEFDKIWYEGYNGKETQGQEKFGKYIKSFISQLLSTERERVVKIVEGMRKNFKYIKGDCDSCNYMENSGEEHRCENINDTLDDLLKTLTPSSQDEEK